MERALGPELRKLSNLCCRYIEQETNKKNVDAITGTNSWIIGYIGHQNAKGKQVYQRDIEKRFGVTRSTASKVVSLMVQKGLIEQREVPEDKRQKLLVLTNRALEVKKLMDEDHEHFEQTLRQGFSDAELEQLFSLLDRMQDNLKRLSGKEEKHD